MIGDFLRFLVRLRFRVYRAYPVSRQCRIGMTALLLTRGGVQRRLGRTLRPVDPSNGVLPDVAACRQAEQRVFDLGLVPHYTRTKNWDFLKAFKILVDHVRRDEPVLDAGSGAFSVILEWLDAAGYQDLRACDYVVEREGRIGGIDYSKQDLTRTTYADHAFAAITCLSVIEHNVDARRFLAEMHRILRPDGTLIVSTDYWPEKIDTTDIRPYGDELGDTHIFSERELRAFIDEARRAGFEPLDPMPYGAKDRAVTWSIIPEGYTFAFVAFRKRREAD